MTDVKSRPLLNNIQALRAIAAYMVVIFHARLLTPIGAMMSFEFGNAGVDIFFFISGFIINHVAARDDVGRPGGFLAKRAIRIVPLYWILTIAVGIAGRLAPSLAGAGGFPDVERIVKSLLFIPYFDDTGEMHPVLFMGWTLNYEIFFYLVFAAALLIGREAARLLAVSSVLIALILAGAILEPQGAAGTTYSSPLLLEFVVGMWMNLAYRAWPAQTIDGAGRAMLVAAMLAGFALLVAGDYAWPQIVREVKWGVPAFAIVAAALMLERGGVSLRWRWLLLLGEASYAIYLIHPFVIKAVGIAYARLGVTSLTLHAIALFGVLVVVAVVGIGFHLLLEKPLIRALRHGILRRYVTSVATGDLSSSPSVNDPCR